MIPRIMLTELLILGPLTILCYHRILPPYVAMLAIGTIYWLPVTLFIRPLNYFYPDVITRGVAGNKLIALTFDDVPYQGLENLNRIVELLDQRNMKGTFFIISDYVAVDDRAKEKLIDMVRSGHQLGNHGRRNIMHYLLSTQSLMDEIKACDHVIQAIYREAGRPVPVPSVYRPGCGMFNGKMINSSHESGYRVALGSVYPNDPVIRWPSINYYYLKYHIDENDIVIVHDRAWTPRMLEMLLPYLDSNGYRSVTMQEILAG